MANKIQGEDVLLVQKTAFVRNYSDDSKLKGQSYRIYSYEGKAFVVNTSDATFEKEFDNGGIHTLSLDTNEEGKLSLTGYITFARMRGMKDNQARLDAISVDNYKAVAVSPQEAFA